MVGQVYPVGLLFVVDLVAVVVSDIPLFFFVFFVVSFKFASDVISTGTPLPLQVSSKQR